MIAKQPNGLYCRVSTVVEAPTHWNMTLDELNGYLRDSAQLKKGKPIKKWLDMYEVSFEEACRNISDLNMTQEDIGEWVKDVNGSV